MVVFGSKTLEIKVFSGAYWNLDCSFAFTQISPLIGIYPL